MQEPISDCGVAGRRADVEDSGPCGAQAESAKVLAALGELKALWAFYLREDAHAADQGGAATASLAKTLRREAQSRVDEGKKHAADALALEPEGVEANRAIRDAIADYVSGASRLAPTLGLTTFQQRLAAFQDCSVFTEAGTTYDEFFGYQAPVWYDTDGKWLGQP